MNTKSQKDASLALLRNSEKCFYQNKIQKFPLHSFICEGYKLKENVFIGHGVMFINDRFPKACNKSGIPLKDGEWHLENTLIKRSASIGSGAVILCGVTIGEGALIGAGAVVTKDVDAFSVVSGVPARLLLNSTNE